MQPGSAPSRATTFGSTSKGGLTPIGGISEWQGIPLTLQIDDANGKRLDYGIENLRL
jgi:hypothetical protein